MVAIVFGLFAAFSIIFCIIALQPAGKSGTYANVSHILKRECASCHGQVDGLEYWSTSVTKGTPPKMVIPGNPTKSRLSQVVHSRGKDMMPPA
ncbi:MAG: c-type cytochrome domain-containing protein, partial [Fimbriimonadaceae bacterium]